MTPRQQELIELVNAQGTGVFRQHIPSAEVAAANHAELMRAHSRKPEDCTTPATDRTFPATDAEKLRYVRDMFEAVWDWSDYSEMAKTLGAESMRLWQEALSLPPDDPRKAALLENIPSRAWQQKKVLSRVLSDYVVEEICWRLLVSRSRTPCLAGSSAAS